MPEITVTDAAIEGLAAKLEGLSHELTDRERAALEGIFVLAGAAVHSASGDVEGFGAEPRDVGDVELHVGTETGGVLRAFSDGVASGLQRVRLEQAQP